ncbi:glycine betaine ABC transporter substrate-binding protein [Salinibacter ruber]|nr:glycine betaine ABC transporter substrate-binding protein [Salinibacter ruber]MCS3639249.1 osmoprotectant transport system permease protein [Salinibacter ruber]MCS3662286.1 osmoprotectant transport system permease protein [Salinibacter ruber]MCS4116249.1 osmoprotectant transport system permease protein [Salinibacter ruber]MCS4181909.1 osmoprotectant transport system permease protein [Salinibacter ruber]
MHAPMPQSASPIVRSSIFSALLSIFVVLSLAAAPAQGQATDSTLALGSKKFTENVILGWMGTHLIRAEGLTATHREELGGSRFLWEALRRGDIDAYPEYTGTLRQELLADVDIAPGALADTLARYGIAMTAPLGFNNTYALGMRADQAAALGIESIADLQDHPDLRFGFTNEFMDRSDGWPSLRRAYDLPQSARGLDHDIAYRGLANGEIDVIDLYSTDAKIEQYDLRVLEDNKDHFPAYEALFLYRRDLATRAPAAVTALKRLAGQIPADTMQRLNARSNIDQTDEATVAADFLNQSLGLNATADADTRVERLRRYTADHLVLVGLSLGLAILFGVPLGVVAAKRRFLGPGVLIVVGVIYTIPALALLAMMVPPLGLGRVPAVTALTLYSLLPIVWTTYTGLKDISGPLRESADALGLSAPAKLWRVELPLAGRSILAGIKIAVIINIGAATLGALIGAGGYGQPILTGIRRANLGLILEGTVPAAVLTILALGLLEGLERGLLPRSMQS